MTGSRLHVGIAVNTVTGFGRQILRGVTKYAAIRRQWLLMKEFVVFETDPRAWPACDGVIAAVSDAKILRQFKKISPHVISCSGSADPRITPVVCMDDQAVGRLAAEHLMDLRLVHFGFYGDRDGARRLSNNRLRGFRQALAHGNHTCQEAPMSYHWRCPLRRGWQDHWPELIRWIHGLPKPVGILAVDDMAADDLSAACLDASISIPDSVALIGVNNDDLICEGAWPPLSSVQPDYQRVGYAAAETLDALMNGNGTPRKNLLRQLPPAGVVRRTSTDVLAVDDPQLAAALRFIREHACRPCGVGDVLREVPVARRWLEKQFVEKLGRTPHDEIMHVRMDQARRLLLNRELTIEHIAQSVGFSTVQSFNRAFRGATQESPAAFRRLRTARVGI